MADSKIESRLFINGNFVDSLEGKTFEFKGANGKETVAVIQEAGAADIDAAVEAAEASWRSWAESASTRATVLNKWADLLEANSAELGRLDSISMGKPVAFATGEQYAAASAIRHFAALGLFVHGDTSLSNPNTVNVTLRQPYGIVCGIIPWNFTAMMASWKMGAALAAGNAIILKSSEKSPLVPLLMAKLAHEAGVPAGVLSVVSGAGNTGRLLSENMKIRKIAFTGSTATGRAIQIAAAKSNLKAVTLELGGKSPIIVFADADIPNAVGQACSSILYNSGQVCVAGSRLYVEKSIEADFTKALTDAFKAYKAGDVLDQNTTHGPQADDGQGQKVAEYIEIGKKEGKLVVGGKRIESAAGHAIEPTLFTGIPDTGRLNVEEIFGPVLVMHSFETEAEVLKRANDTEYGLFAAVFTKDSAKALRMAKGLEAGIVGVNNTSGSMAFDIPFGGYKSSGVGRELGSDAVKAWTQVKSVFMSVPAA